MCYVALRARFAISKKLFPVPTAKTLADIIYCAALINLRGSVKCVVYVIVIYGRGLHYVFERPKGCAPLNWPGV
jgi:hypothetical protein